MILLGGVVFGILAQVSLVAGISDLLAQVRTFHSTKLMEFIQQFLKSLFGIVGRVAHISGIGCNEGRGPRKVLFFKDIELGSETHPDPDAMHTGERIRRAVAIVDGHS